MVDWVYYMLKFVSAYRVFRLFALQNNRLLAREILICLHNTYVICRLLGGSVKLG